MYSVGQVPLLQQHSEKPLIGSLVELQNDEKEL